MPGAVLQLNFQWFIVFVFSSFAAPSPKSLRKKSSKKLHKTVGEKKEQSERSPDGVVDLRWQGRHRKECRRLIALGLENNPLAHKEDSSARGRTAQSKTVNLLLRLQDKKDEVLRFMLQRQTTKLPMQNFFRQAGQFILP